MPRICVRCVSFSGAVGRLASEREREHEVPTKRG